MLFLHINKKIKKIFNPVKNRNEKWWLIDNANYEFGNNSQTSARLWHMLTN